MKLQLFFAAWFLSAVAAVAQGEVRKWTDNSGGFSVQAEFVELAGNQVALKREDGTTIHVPLEKLSSADQEYVRQKTPSKPANPFAVNGQPSLPQSKPSQQDDFTAGAGDDPGTLREIVATGKGATEEEAKRDAFHNAVEQAVGVYVDATTIANNEKLIEDSVLTYSNAYIKSFTVVRSSSANGVHTIKIRAMVKVQRLAEKLQSQGIKSVAVDGQSLAAEIVTTKRMQEDAKTLLQKAVGDFPLQFVEFVPSGKFVPNEKGGLDTTVEYRVNKERYRKYIAQIEKVLKPHAQASGLGSVDYSGDKTTLYDFTKLPFSELSHKRDPDKEQYVVMLGTTISNKEGRRNGNRYEIKEVTVHCYHLDKDAGPVTLEAWKRATDLSLHCELQDSQGNIISEVVKQPCHDNVNLNRDAHHADSLPGGPVEDRGTPLSDNCYNGITAWDPHTRVILILPKITRRTGAFPIPTYHVLRDTLELPCHFDVSVEEIGRAKKLVVTPSLPPMENRDGKPTAKE
jgi:hypothetical protein